MFSKEELEIITRALTGYEIEIAEAIDAAKNLEGSELFIEDLNKTLIEIREVEAKARERKLKMLVREYEIEK